MESAVQAVFVSDEYSVHATTNRSQSSHFRSSSSFLVVANEGHANLREKGARVSGFRDRGGSIIYSTSSRAASRWVTCTFRDVVKKETRRGSNARKKRGRTTRENDATYPHAIYQPPPHKGTPEPGALFGITMLIVRSMPRKMPGK